ncbi:MAG TPA: hypothetical protein VF228_20430 [Iamia sp.]
MAALLLLGAAACGGDDDDRATAAATTTGPTTTTSTTPPTTTSTTTTLPPVDATVGIGGSAYLGRIVPGADGQARVEVVDLVTGEVRVVTTTDPALRPGDLAVSPDGERVAWSEGDEGDVHVGGLPDQPAVVVDVAAGCPHWLPDGDLLVTVADAAGGVAVVDPATGVSERLPYRFGQMACGMPVGSDEIGFLRREGTDMTTGGAEIVRAPLDPRDGPSEVVARIPDGCEAFGLGVDPAGERFAVSVTCTDDPGRSGLWVTDANGELAPLVTEGSTGSRCEYSAPAWSAAGTAVAYHRVELVGDDRGTPRVWVAQVADGTTAPHAEGTWAAWPDLS